MTKIHGFENHFITIDGRIFNNKKGNYFEHKITKRENKYAYVFLREEGKRKRSYEVHNLLAITFLDKDYAKKGLCVLHLDDNKHNCTLSNIKIGTYSENLKSAYKNGLNKGNVLGISNSEKEVEMIDKNTSEVIKTFESGKAALRYLNKDENYSNISKVCRGKANTAFGYKWRFKYN